MASEGDWAVARGNKRYLNSPDLKARLRDRIVTSRSCFRTLIRNLRIGNEDLSERCDRKTRSSLCERHSSKRWCSICFSDEGSTRDIDLCLRTRLAQLLLGQLEAAAFAEM